MRVRKLGAEMVRLVARLDRVSAIAVYTPAASLMKQIYTN